MKVIQTEVFEFDELDDAAKEKAREWYRSASVGDNSFAEFVIEESAGVIGKAMGIDMDMHDVGKHQEPNIWWSGFSSQGDGACFEGTWRASNVDAKALKEYAPKDEELHRIVGEFERIAKAFPHSSFKVNHSGHYHHKYCTNFDVTITDNDDSEIDTPESNQAGKDLVEVARDFMQWIYDSLKEAWEYEISDENVDEVIRANEYTFKKTGERFG